MGFGVWGLGFGVWGLGFGVWGLGFGVWGLGFGAMFGVGCFCKGPKRAKRGTTQLPGERVYRVDRVSRIFFGFAGFVGFWGFRVWLRRGGAGLPTLNPPELT